MSLATNNSEYARMCMNLVFNLYQNFSFLHGGLYAFLNHYENRKHTPSKILNVDVEEQSLVNVPHLLKCVEMYYRLKDFHPLHFYHSLRFLTRRNHEDSKLTLCSFQTMVYFSSNAQLQLSQILEFDIIISYLDKETKKAWNVFRYRMPSLINGICSHGHYVAKKMCLEISDMATGRELCSPFTMKVAEVIRTLREEEERRRRRRREEEEMDVS